MKDLRSELPYFAVEMKKIKGLVMRLPKPLRGINALALIGFLVWMSAFDRHNVVNRAKQIKELRDARQQVSFYKSEIAIAENDLQQLFSSPENIERFARERFYLKRDNEDVFVIDETPNGP